MKQIVGTKELQAIVNYLQERPHKEVVNLLAGLLANCIAAPEEVVTTPSIRDSDEEITF